MTGIETSFRTNPSKLSRGNGTPSLLPGTDTTSDIHVKDSKLGVSGDEILSFNSKYDLDGKTPSSYTVL